MASTLQNLLKSKAVKDAQSLNKTETVSGGDASPVVPLPGKETSPTSPEKNFTKVPNSVANEAIPQGMFKGLSKHTYDVLYTLTRGAVSPRREILLTRFELMKLTGLSENTQRAHVKYLAVAGLLKVTYRVGKHDGAIYEILVPEERDSTDGDPYQVVPSSTNPYQVVPSSTKYYQKLVPDPYQKLVVLGTTNPLENKGVSDSLRQRKTKSKNDDDYAFARFLEKFQSASEEITGRKLSGRDGEDLAKLADLLILELKMAARRTGDISSMPAFLTEVLRRKLRGTTAPAAAKTSKVKVDTVGKPEPESYEVVALDKKGREAALEQLREFAGDDFLPDFKKWYTAEDWQWMMEELGTNALN